MYVQKLCFRLGKLVSKISQAPSQQKRRLKKAASRLRCKIKNLIKELHHKVARFLVDNFDVIFLPIFETSQMVSKSRRKLRNKTVRQMLTRERVTYVMSINTDKDCNHFFTYHQ